jgi:hypothetical protein
MTRDDIIKMAKQAKLPYEYDTGRLLHLKEVEHFAALVAAAEREACAKVCEDVWNHRKGLETGTALECVVAIRARGEK